MREAARIQSFSDDFRFLGSYVDKAGQIGNAVPPLVMEKMAHQILHCLSIIQDIEISGHNISPHQISLGI
jgi:site-specific DNA-cytosine methylase